MATQTTVRPTNKLAVGSAVAGIVGTQAAPLVQEVWPQIAPLILSGPVVTETLALLIAVLSGVVVGWFVPDAPNVPT